MISSIASDFARFVVLCGAQFLFSFSYSPAYGAFNVPKTYAEYSKLAVGTPTSAINRAFLRRAGPITNWPKYKVLGFMANAMNSLHWTLE